MDPKPVTWKREWRGTIQGHEEDPDDHYELVVSETDGTFGKFHWRASDYMAWRSEESHGDGFAETVELAQEAARQWYFVDRFGKQAGIDAIVF